MKTFISAAVVCACVFWAPFAVCAEEKQQSPPASQPSSPVGDARDGRGGPNNRSPAGSRAATQEAPTEFVYKQRQGRSAPKNRTGGGTRGGPGDAFPFCLLVPDEVVAKSGGGEETVSPLTISAQPKLYWYAYKPIAEQLLFTINDPAAQKTVIKATLNGPREPGIQSIDLSNAAINRSNFKLKPGVDYDWNVCLASSRKIFASGLISLTTQAPPIDASADPASRATVLAQAGIWYDALAALSEAIEKNPKDASLRARRAGLLEQIGLKDVADADRQIPDPIEIDSTKR